jgi:Fe-S-cluster containining protein
VARDVLRLEASELRGQSFRCLPGCGFCCLCEPGLSAEERARFPGKLARGVRADGQALRMVGQAGPCALLSAERACTQYELRPRGCRSFPFHTTMGWRAQVNVNRGCPGTWVQGPEAARGFDPAQALPPGPEADAAARAGRAAWDHFRAQAHAAGVYAPPRDVQRRLAACLPLLADEDGLAAGLALAEAGLPVTARNLRRGIGRAPIEPLREFLGAQARATFGQRDAKRLPLHVEPEGFAWWAFRLRGDAVERCAIDARGALRPDGRVPLEPLPLLPLDARAAALRAAHAEVLVRRDLLVSLAAFMLDRLGYGEPLASAALRELVAALGDLWLRAGLLARFAGEETIGAPRMERGIAFFDMDFLNAPTLGVAF